MPRPDRTDISPQEYYDEEEYFISQPDMDTPIFDTSPSPMQGIAFHVHNVFENIKENFEEIMETLGGQVDLTIFKIGPVEFCRALNEAFKKIMLKIGYSDRVFQKKTDEIQTVLAKLCLAKEQVTEKTINEMFTWIQFVLRQPVEFQVHYVNFFIEDTFYGYNGAINSDTVSCTKGIYERILLSIGDACVGYCTEFKKKRKRKLNKSARKRKSKSKKNQTISGGGENKSVFHSCDNALYRKLIRLFKKEIPDMNEMTKEWAKIFDEDFSKNLTPELLQDNFITFMNNKYTRYGVNHSSAVQKRAQEFAAADVFKNRGFG